MALAATAQTWGTSGPTFLLAYVLIALAVTVATTRARRALAAPGTAAAPADLPTSPYAVAHLRGGPDLAVHAALGALHLRGTVTGSDGRVQAFGRPGPDADPLEAAVCAVAATPVAARRLAFHRPVHVALTAIEERLVADGFLLADRQRRRIRRLGWPMLAVAGLGLVRLVVDVAEARPVGLLAAALLVVTVVALAQLTRAPRRSRRGDRALTALRHRHDRPAADRPADAALRIGLFGASAMQECVPAFAAEISTRRGASTAGTAAPP